eukprot:3876094-Amphidinium_carterae.1
MSDGVIRLSPGVAPCAHAYCRLLQQGAFRTIVLLSAQYSSEVYLCLADGFRAYENDVGVQQDLQCYGAHKARAVPERKDGRAAMQIVRCRQDDAADHGGDEDDDG